MKKEKQKCLLLMTLLLPASFVLFFSCGGSQKNQAPTYGNLTFGCEKSLKFIAGSEIKVFHHFYPDANIKAEYKDENALFQSFINDSSRLIIGYRDFTAQERKFLFDRKTVPYSTVIGLEGIAIITHPENPDTAITAGQLMQLLTGTGDSLNSIQQKWKDVVFDGAGSANLRFLDSLIGGKKLADYVFSKDNSDSTFAFIASHKNAIGIVSFGLIADKEDPRAMVNRNKIKILSVSADGKNYYRPCQRNFVNNVYPFTRRIYMHCRDYDGSLAMGFISFVSSEEGQLIIKRGELLPARLSWRDMEVKFEPMNIK